MFAQIQFREIKKSLILEGKIFLWDFLMTSFISFFLLVYGRTILVLQIFFLLIYPSSYSILILYGFFLKKKFRFWILKKQIWLDRREKKIFRLDIFTNFEEKKLFQHFANLIKIRSTHLCRSNYTPAPRRGRGVYCFTTVCLSVRPSKIFFSATWWQKSDIWSQVSYRYPISWEAFLGLSDSYFLFANFVDFYTHLTYILYKVSVFFCQSEIQDGRHRRT